MGHRPSPLQRFRALGTVSSNVSEANLSVAANPPSTGSLTSTTTSNAKVPESNVGAQEIKKWVETGTLGDGIPLETEKKAGKAKEEKDTENEDENAGLGKCWKCSTGRIAWAKQGEYFLVCVECGEPN